MEILSQQSVNKYHTIEMKKILFLIFSVFVCLQTLSGRGKVFDYPCDFYPNKKMDRMLKKYGNLYYRISGYSCVAHSQTDSGIKMIKFNNNKVQKKKNIENVFVGNFNHQYVKDMLEKISWDCIGSSEYDEQIFFYNLMEKGAKISVGCEGSWDCIIPSVSDPVLRKIMLLLKDYE